MATDVEIRFVLCLPREEATVPIVRHMCRDALDNLGVAERCVDDIEVAVSEACTNVLKHATAGGDQYEVSVALNEAKCEISVVDAGGQFDHESLGGGLAPAGAEGGRGIHLMTVLVDKLRFVSTPETGTVVHLEKDLEFTARSVVRTFAPRSPVGS